jgi:hypothetical protein
VRQAKFELVGNSKTVGSSLGQVTACPRTRRLPRCLKDVRPRSPAAAAFPSAREHRRLMQEGVVLDLPDEEIRYVGARDEPPCPAARIDQRAIGVRVRRANLKYRPLKPMSGWSARRYLPT